MMRPVRMSPKAKLLKSVLSHSYQRLVQMCIICLLIEIDMHINWCNYHLIKSKSEKCVSLKYLGKAFRSEYMLREPLSMLFLYVLLL
jgi:hypothetical protein